MELLLSFVITWIVVLVPPAVIRIIRRRPIGKKIAITLCVIFYFANIVLFTLLGSSSKSHGALLIGAFFSYFIFMWQTNASSAREARDHRKSLGYDDQKLNDQE